MSKQSAHQDNSSNDDEYFADGDVAIERQIMDANFSSHLEQIRQIHFQEELARLEDDEGVYSQLPEYNESFKQGFEEGMKKGSLEGEIEYSK